MDQTETEKKRYTLQKLESALLQFGLISWNSHAL